VSGLAALLLERKPSLTPSEIRTVLMITARPLGPTRPDSDFGAGLVNAYRAVTWLDRTPPGPNDGGGQAKQ
jgi:serine protease AprX